MAQRSALFSLAFPDKKIAPSSLRCLYLRHGIKRKKVASVKVYPQRHLASYHKWRQIILQKLKEVGDYGLKIIYLDEVNFTKRSLQTLEWSGKYSNLCVNQDDVYFGYKSVIAAVSVEKGVELIQIQDHAVN